VSFLTLNVAGRNYNRFGPKPIVMTGLSVLLLTTLFCTRLTGSTPVPPIIALVILRGLALGLCGQTIQVVAFNTVPEGQMPRATALLNMFMRVNSSFVTAILTSVLVMSLAFHGAPAGSSIANRTAPLPFMLTAFREAFWLQTVITACGVGMAFFLKDRVLNEWRRGRDEAPASAALEPEAATAEA
jgi:hypothetical protein